MRPSILSLFLAALLPLAANDTSKPWDRVEFSVPLEFGKASVKVAGTNKVDAVTLSVGGVTIEVPEEELEGCPKPQLDTAQLLFGSGHYGPVKEDEEPIPHYIVEMSFGERSAFGAFSSVRFLFHSGKYQEKILLTQTSPSSWKQTRKPVGEEAFDAGTMTRMPGR